MFGFWSRVAGVFLMAGLIALVVGKGLGAGWGFGFFGLALAAHLVGHLRRLKQLMGWLDARTRTELPKARGLWDEVFCSLERQVKRGKRSEAKLSSALERFEHAAQAIPDGIVMLTNTDQIEWFNPAAALHLGLNAERDRNQFIRYLIRSQPFYEYLSAGDYSQTLVLRSPADRDRLLSVQLVPFAKKRRLLLTRDVTELERVDAMRRDFVANVSHEMRTPLTVVGGFVETIGEMDAIPPEDLKRYLGLMAEQTRRMQRLVDDLLTLSKLESPLNKLVEAPVDMPGMCRALLNDALGLSQGRHQITLNAELQDWLTGNADELMSAFGNLVSNAVRYTPDGGAISLSWRMQEGEPVFAVTDTGEGIAAHHIPRLTERFYRVDRGRSRSTGGTGLGLAIAKHVLQRHGARLGVQSVPGRGSTFSAAFPAFRLIPPVAAGALPAPAEARPASPA